MAIGRSRAKSGSSAEKLIATGLGFAFLAVLAYAGLRERPITDPGQILFLRVVAAVSAAACAAIIPGFIEVKFKTWLRAGGALAVFTIVWFTNPPALVGTPEASAATPKAFTVIVPGPNAMAEIDPDDRGHSPFMIEVAGKQHALRRRGLLVGATGIPMTVERTYRTHVVTGEPDVVATVLDAVTVKSLRITRDGRACEVPTFDQLNGRVWALELDTCK